MLLQTCRYELVVTWGIAAALCIKLIYLDALDLQERTIGTNLDEEKPSGGDLSTV